MSDPRWTYVDTSVLVKRYVREPGSAEAGRLTRCAASLALQGGKDSADAEGVL